MMPRTTQIGYARSGIGPTCHRLREGLGRKATGMFRDVTALVAPLAHFARFSRTAPMVRLRGGVCGRSSAGRGRAVWRHGRSGEGAGAGRYGDREERVALQVTVHGGSGR